MKKIITCLSAAFISLSSLSFTATAEEAKPVIDGETFIKMMDVVRAENDIPEDNTFGIYLAKHEVKPDEFIEQIEFYYWTRAQLNVYHPYFEAVYQNYEVTVPIVFIVSNGAFETEEFVDPRYLLGDITEDGAVQIEDAQLALTAYTEALGGNEPPLTELQRKAADPNGDGALTVEDAQYILNYYTANTLGGNARSWVDIVVRGLQ